MSELTSCHHYSRRCSIVSPCCDKEYSCRFCHDEEEYENQDDYKLKHKIDRYKIDQVICLKCSTKQSIKQYCENCNECMGNYYCDICHLFDDDDKQQFHCEKCNICRVGGVDNYNHCDTCNMCIIKDIQHVCVPVKDSLCPVCQDDLFTSVTLVTSMKCGHYIHKECLLELMETTYKCPLCCASLGNTDLLNSYIDQEIINTPMPQDYNYNVKILCNDCHVESDTKFHIIGLKCLECNGYNTKQV
jgi:RING finger/CHY zinc finger protein 1